MIQFKRGETKSWRKQTKPLAAGQPGYDKNKHKLKIGDGKSSWSALPYASGLSAEEILDSEEHAKAKKLDSEDTIIITYGTEKPNDDTVGQIYLQHYEAEPEVDYVVSSGVDGIWSYQKWNSGVAKCFGTFDHATQIQSAIGSVLYQNSVEMQKFNYPFTFKTAPSETAMVQSPGGLVWLAAAKGLNTTKQTATYKIVSPDKINNAVYKVSIQVEGRWK